MFLVTLLVAVIAFYFGRGLKVENFGKIKVGTTEREVERLLGGAPGHYGTKWGPGRMTAEGFVCDGREEIWTNDNTMLEVCFDADGTVVGKHQRAGYSRESLIAHWLRGKRSR
jgi:hypothetical protein